MLDPEKNLSSFRDSACHRDTGRHQYKKNELKVKSTSGQHTLVEDFSQSDWSREQLTDPICCETMTYLDRGYPISFPLDVLRENADSFGVEAASTRDVLKLAYRM